MRKFTVLWTIGRRIVYNISKQKHSLAVNTIARQEKEFENVESASHSGGRREAEGEHSWAFARDVALGTSWKCAGWVSVRCHWSQAVREVHVDGAADAPGARQCLLSQFRVDGSRRA